MKFLWTVSTAAWLGAAVANFLLGNKIEGMLALLLMQTSLVLLERQA